MISTIRNPWVRRSLVVLTALASALVLLPLLLPRAVYAAIRDGIGEELRTAWDGEHGK